MFKIEDTINSIKNFIYQNPQLTAVALGIVLVVCCRKWIGRTVAWLCRCFGASRKADQIARQHLSIFRSDEIVESHQFKKPAIKSYVLEPAKLKTGTIQFIFDDIFEAGFKPAAFEISSVSELEQLVELGPTIISIGNNQLIVIDQFTETTVKILEPYAEREMIITRKALEERFRVGAALQIP